jgi:hypothetical protein
MFNILFQQIDNLFILVSYIILAIYSSMAWFMVFIATLNNISVISSMAMRQTARAYTGTDCDLDVFSIEHLI